MKVQTEDHIMQETMNTVAEEVRTIMDASENSVPEIKGRKTCLVKQSFQQLLIHCKYIRFNKQFETKLTKIEKQLEQLQAPKPEILDSISEKKDAIYKKETDILHQKENLSKLSDAMPETQLMELQQIIDEQAQKLENAKMELKRDPSNIMVNDYYNQKHSLEHSREELLDKKKAYDSLPEVDMTVKKNIQELSHIQQDGEKIRQDYYDELQKIEDLLRDTQEKKLDFMTGIASDNYKVRMSQALQNNDIDAIKEIGKNHEQQLTAMESSIQEQQERKHTIEEKLAVLPQTKRKLKLQTSIPYIVAKGMQNIGSAIVSDIVKMAEKSVQDRARIHTYEQGIQSVLGQTESLIQANQAKLEDLTKGAQREVYKTRMSNALTYGSPKEIKKIESIYQNQLTNIQTNIQNLEICRETLQHHLKELSRKKRYLKLQFSKPYMNAQQVNKVKSQQSLEREDSHIPHESISPEDDIHTLLNQALENCAGDEMGFKQLRGLIASIAHMGVDGNHPEDTKKR